MASNSCELVSTFATSGTSREPSEWSGVQQSEVVARYRSRNAPTTASGSTPSTSTKLSIVLASKRPRVVEHLAIPLRRACEARILARVHQHETSPRPTLRRVL